MDLLRIGLTGLQTSRTNLNVTGHNVSNINTDGYSRQRTEQLTNTPLYKGYGAKGTGAHIQSVQRIVDDFITRQVRIDTSRLHYSKEFLQNLNELDNLVSGQSTSMSSAFENFFKAVQSATQKPLLKSDRELIITSAKDIVRRFSAINNKLNDQNTTINDKIRIASNKVNKLASDIAQLNKDIYEGYMKGNNNPPNDLLDLREERLRELSEIVDVQTVLQDGMQMNVTIGNGQPIVVGSSAYKLQAVAGRADATRTDINLVGKKDTLEVINKNITGGQLGSLLRYREEVLDKSFDKLGRLALVFANEVNRQHARGVDLNDQPGGDLFKDINSPDLMRTRIKPVGGKNKNAGGELTVEITNTSVLQASEYKLMVQDGKFVIRSLDGKLLDYKTLPNNSGTLDFSDTLGFRINVPGVGMEGDNWLVMPTRFGTEQIKTEISDINKLALRGIGSPKTNTGTASFSYIEGQFGPVTPFGSQITYTVAGGVETFNLVDNTGNAITPAPTITRNGNRLTFSGVPAAHSFTVEFKGVPKSGDKWILEGKTGQSAANNIAAVQRDKTINSGTGMGSSLIEAYAEYVELIGNTTNSYKVSYKTNDSVLKQTLKLQSSVSGVNMDEEAANIIKFQQAYQAAAQVMATAQTIFNAVLSIKG